MDREGLDIFTHLLVATMAGGLIGLERSYHGRPAGFRTHTLVCVASSLLMLVTMYQAKWFSGAAGCEFEIAFEKWLFRRQYKLPIVGNG
jgi:putative Mg2+ transporter-C (MgtC) family protein